MKAYLEEAIANQKAGKEVKADRSEKKLVMSDELKSALDSDAKLKVAFESLTPGKQREYADHISSSKQEKTRMARLEKVKPLILDKKGLYDKYKNC